VRIDLADKEESRRRRKKGRRSGKRRRSQSFETAITLPQIQTGQRSQKGRTPARASRAERQRRTIEAKAKPAAKRIEWRRFWRRFPVLVMALGLIGLAAYVSIDSRFFVYGAQITGAKHLETELIYQTAGVDEQNIFWIDPQEVAERIIELDGIRAVHVRCDLPAAVSIEVQEREPLVLWRALAQERDWWLDREGVVLPYHGDVHSPDTVFVVDYSDRHMEVGDHIEPKGTVQSVLQMAVAVPQAEVFYYQADRGLSFSQRVEGGEWPVYVGTSEDLPRKIQVVQALTEYLVANNIQPRYVDVRWADHPVYGKQEAPEGGAPGGGE
jgi:hypothetical protein